MIRAVLVQHGPNLAHYFGIRPWELGRLSLVELRTFINALEDIAWEQRGQ